MYHQTNFDCKSFSISKDLVETIVALTLNIAKWYFWMIFWLMMMHHHTKFDWSEILSGQTFTEVQNLHCDLDLEYSKATFSQDTPRLMNMHCQTKLVAKENRQFNMYNRNSPIWLYDCNLFHIYSHVIKQAWKIRWNVVIYQADEKKVSWNMDPSEALSSVTLDTVEILEPIRTKLNLYNLVLLLLLLLLLFLLLLLLLCERERVKLVICI